VASRGVLLVTTAMGFSILNVCGGSRWVPACLDVRWRRLVFVTDQASPMPWTNTRWPRAPTRAAFDMLAHQLVDEVNALMGIGPPPLLTAVRGKQFTSPSLTESG